MNAPLHTLNRPIDLDATEELPVLDVAAYEASLQSAEATETAVSATPDSRVAFVPGSDPDQLLNVEQWIAHKTNELRALQEALAEARREQGAAESRAAQVSQSLREAATTIDDLEAQGRVLTEALAGQQAAARRAEDERATGELDLARLRTELGGLREADDLQQRALAETRSLLADRSATLAALERTHGDVAAERSRLLAAVAELEARIAAGEARETEARADIDARTRGHAELSARIAGQDRTLTQLNDEVAGLKAQLARCLEQLHTRETYRNVYETNLHELDVELEATKARVAVLAPHAAALEIRVAELLAQVTAHCTTIADLESAAAGRATLLAARDASLADAEQRLAAQSAAMEARGRELHSALAEIEQLRGVHGQALESIATARADHERARLEGDARLAATAHDRDAAVAQMRSLEARLSAATDEADAQRTAIAAAQERARDLESRIADHEARAAVTAAELVHGQAALHELSATAASQQALLAERDRQLAEHQSAAHRHGVEQDALVQVVEALRGEIVRLNDRLAAPESERRALEERAAALTQQLETSEARAARLERVNLELRSTSQQLTRTLAEREVELQRVTRIASTSTYALGRVQSSIDGLGSLTTAPHADGETPPVGLLTRIDDDQHQSIVLRGRKTIGRDADNDIALQARFVSRRHAAVIPSHGSALVEDLRSTNGVIVNGRRVRCARLTHGDVITLGTAKFRYTFGPGADGPSPVAAVQPAT